MDGDHDSTPEVEAFDPATKRLRVAIAGASGFVGRAIRRELKDRFEIVALTRRASTSNRIEPDSDGVVWRTCDLFDDQSVSDAFADVDIVIYLVHSMSPQSRLTQGGFTDLDLVLAHNVRRAADRAGVRRIVFLGGLDADLDESRLSPHLASRREVGIVLRSAQDARPIARRTYVTSCKLQVASYELRAVARRALGAG